MYFTREENIRHSCMYFTCLDFSSDLKTKVLNRHRVQENEKNTETVLMQGKTAQLIAPKLLIKQRHLLLRRAYINV